MLSKVFIYDLKALTTLDFSDLFSLYSCTNKCIDFVSLQAMVSLEYYTWFHSVYFISCRITTNFLGLLNHKLVSSETFSGICFFSWIPCYWNFNILHSNRKCAKRVEISGCKTDWTCSVGYVLVVNLKTDACFIPSWPLCTTFKTCGQFFGNCNFWENRVKYISSKLSIFWVVFSMVHLAIQMHTKNLLKIWLMIKISWKSACLRFLPQKRNITK